MAKIPFDIKFRSQIECGEYSVVTGDDKPVRIICWDRHYDNQHPIVALAYDAKKDIEIYINASVLGEAHSQLKGDNLFIVTPEPELSEFEERIFKLLRQYKECNIPLTPENIKAEASMLWQDLEKYFFVIYGKEGESDSALRSFYYKGLANGKAEARKQLEWLRNLKHKRMWKPSEEQIGILGKVFAGCQLKDSERDSMVDLFYHLKDMI